MQTRPEIIECLRWNIELERCDVVGRHRAMLATRSPPAHRPVRTQTNLPAGVCDFISPRRWFARPKLRSATTSRRGANARRERRRETLHRHQPAFDGTPSRGSPVSASGPARRAGCPPPTARGDTLRLRSRSNTQARTASWLGCTVGQATPSVEWGRGRRLAISAAVRPATDPTSHHDARPCTASTTVQDARLPRRSG
jgi:hypothetical protein